jgi:hypothetical protein
VSARRETGAEYVVGALPLQEARALRSAARQLAAARDRNREFIQRENEQRSRLLCITLLCITLRGIQR